MKKEFKAELINLAEIDKGTKILTVLVSETTKKWFRTRASTAERTFTYVDGLWLDENFLTVTNINMTWRLQEMLVTKMAESRMDRFISTL